MIRFGAVSTVVSVAVALLLVGALSGDLRLVYISIGLAALALVMLVVGVAVWRDQVFGGITSAKGRQVAADEHARAYPSLAPAASVPAGLSQAGPVQAGRPAAAEESRPRTAAAPGWSARPAREPVGPQASALAEHDPPAVRERPDRARDGRQQSKGGQQPGSAGGRGRQRGTSSADRAGPEPSPAGWPGLTAEPEDRSGRAVGRTPRRPQGAEPHQVERAGAAEPPGRRAAGTEPWAEPNASSDEPEPADDPTRLAHRLGIGRESSPAAESPSVRPAEETAASRMRQDLAPESAAERRSSADPLVGPRPVGSSASRTRKPGTGPAEFEAAPAGPAGGGPMAPARPEGFADPAAPQAGPAATPTRSLSSPPNAATTGGPAVDTTGPKTSGTAVTQADQAVPALTGGPPASPAAAAGAAEPGAAEPAMPSDSTPSQPAAAARGAASEAVQDSEQAVTQVLVVPGIARYHRADCILIRFLGEDDLQRISREEAEAAGCAACRACRP
ncbi:MAG TPA: hypothetical protein VH520_08015 [Streptosporangiaceae bacterium]